MEKNNINKNQLAKILSIPSMSIGRWVNGKVSDPTLSKLLNLSKFFEVSIDDIVTKNLQVQDKLKALFINYINIPVFEWNSNLEFNNSKTLRIKRIPQILYIDTEDKIFSISHSEEYYGIYPKKSILILTKNIDEITNNDVLLVNNKIIKQMIFIQYHNNDYRSILTHEKVDINQYNIEGSLINIILTNVFLGLIE